MIKIITTFKKIMTRILLILLCLPMLFSCDQENKVYNAFIGEKGGFNPLFYCMHTL